MVMDDQHPEQPRVTARRRLLDTAYQLFSTRGVRAVGIDEVIERAGVAKATLYKHFPTKGDLVLAFLAEREQRWAIEWVDAESERRGSTPEERLLAIFELFDEWFHRNDFEGCSFVNVLLEMGPSHPAGAACIKHLDNIRDLLRRRAEEAGLRDPEAFAGAWHILMKGSIVQAVEGDVDAAKRVRPMARQLIDHHRSAKERRPAARRQQK